MPDEEELEPEEELEDGEPEEPEEEGGEEEGGEEEPEEEGDPVLVVGGARCGPKKGTTAD